MKKVEVETKKVAPEQPNIAYLGKTIPGLVQHGTVFSNGLPKKLEQMKRENPNLNLLFVPVKDLSSAQEELKTPNSVLYTIYHQM